jgi:hypothetical protein
MDTALVVVLVATVPFAVLTAIGSYHRNHVAPLAVISGLLFPAAWVAWYVRDERRRGTDPPVPGG